MKVLVSAGSKHGSTIEIARAIGEELVRFGHEAEVSLPEDVKGLIGIDAAVIGSGVYAGHWLPAVRELVEKNAARLAEMPVWLFSSGPLGDPPKPDEDPVDVAGLMTMVKGIDHRVFSGRIDLGRLGFAERAVVKALRAPVGDFRDWEVIAAWAAEIAGALSSTSAGAGPLMAETPSV